MQLQEEAFCRIPGTWLIPLVLPGPDSKLHHLLWTVMSLLIVLGYFYLASIFLLRSLSCLILYLASSGCQLLHEDLAIHFST